MAESENRFTGLGVSAGIGMGVAHVRESGAVTVPVYSIPASKVDAELGRLKKAATLSRRQISQIRSKSKEGAAAEELGYLLDAYIHMLKDSRLVRGAERRIAKDRLNAEGAVQAEIAEIGDAFAALDDPYIAARFNDIRAVTNRLLLNLTKGAQRPVSLVPKGSVIVAEELSPADTALLDPQRVAGIATQLGGPQSHTAIMARALGLPTVLGAPGLLDCVNPGDHIIVDGDKGTVVINPAAATLASFMTRHKKDLRETRLLARLRKQPAVTRDGTVIDLQANVELPIELDMVNHAGASGIGLLRSEFMFMNRESLPDEDEQYQALSSLVKSMGRRPVTVRTLDIGADKTTAALMGDFGSSTTSPLGLRGIRLSLTRVDILETQFRAILRAGAEGTVRILLPMVSSVAEVRRARKILDKAARHLKRRGVLFADPLPPVGVMIEVPSAALAADSLAQDSDFFALGSNDLTMYTLAIDRSDDQVAHLFDHLHPAVLRLIQFSAEAGLRARIPVSICGEMAGDPRFTALLLGLGFRELSMTAFNIPRVKKRIRNVDLIAADHRARVIMDQVDSGRIAILLDDFNALA